MEDSEELSAEGGIVMAIIFMIIMFVLLFDGHAIRKQNEELKAQNEKILAEIEYLKEKL